MSKVKVHIFELVPAFHNGSESARFFLDRNTGQVLLDFDGIMYDENGEDIRSLLQSDSGRFVQIESIGKRETEHMMREFIAGETSPIAAKALNEALSSFRPFQNFRNGVNDFPDVQKRWYEFEQKWVETLARNWLKEHDVDAELLIPEAQLNQESQIDQEA